MGGQGLSEPDGNTTTWLAKDAEFLGWHWAKVSVTLISHNVRTHQNLINCQKSTASSLWMRNNVAICLPGHVYRMGWLIEKKNKSYPERHNRPLCVCSCEKIKDHRL